MSTSFLLLKTGLVGVSLSFSSGVFIPSLPNDSVHFNDLLVLVPPPLALFLVLSLSTDDLCCHVGDLFDEQRCRLGYVKSVLMPIKLTQDGAMLQHQDCLLPLSSVFQVV